MKARTRAKWQTTTSTALVLLLAGIVGAALADSGATGGTQGSTPDEEPLLDPELIVADATFSDAASGDGDGVIEDGEVIEMTFTLTNVGAGRSLGSSLRAEWAPEVGDRFQWIVNEVAVGSIGRGQSARVGPLRFAVNTGEQLAVGVYELSCSGRFSSRSLGDLAVGANPSDFTRLVGGGVHLGVARRNDRYLVWKSSNGPLMARDMDTGLEWQVTPFSPETMALHGHWVAHAGGAGDAVRVRMANLETGEVIEVANGRPDWPVDGEVEPALNDRYLVFASYRDDVLFPPAFEDEPPESPWGEPALRVLDLRTLTHRRVTDGWGEGAPALDGSLLAFGKDKRVFLTDLDDPSGSRTLLYDTGDWAEPILDVDIGGGYVCAVSTGHLFMQDLETGEQTVTPLFGGLDLNWPTRLDLGDGWAALSNYKTLRLIRLEDRAMVQFQKHWWFRPAALDGRYLVYTILHELGWPLEIRQEILPPGNVQGPAPFVANRSAAVGETVPGVGRSSEAWGSPAGIALHGSHPNPFRGMTTIAFDMPHASMVDLRIYDAGGRLVRTLMSDRLEPGRRQVRWDGRDGAGRPAAAGVYFYRLEAGDLRETRTLVRLQ